MAAALRDGLASLRPNQGGSRKCSRKKRRRRQQRHVMALVARTVGRAEYRQNPKALAALATEWGKLRKAGVWRDEDVREWADVKEQARREGRDVHIGSLHELLVEKGSELPEGDEKRKFKGRVVFLGDQVKDREGNYALFEELSSSPAEYW